jgi:nucleoid-associated protein EbfC
MAQPNMNQLLKQAQAMQAEMMKAQEQLKEEVVEASAGGGMVTVKISGDLELKEIKIDPSALGDDPSKGGDADDVEMLQDLVTAAVNEALDASRRLAEQKMGAMQSLGGLSGLLGR